MKQTFYSNGKLLLTGEYVVLDGAKALAIPTKKGQSLVITENDSGIIEWKSFDCHNQTWYTTKISTHHFFSHTAPKGDSKFDTTLFKILWEALHANPSFLNKTKGYHIETHLTFERLWGLGTSSTLINNIAQWATINPYELLHKSFGGSGYDIACASANTPIFYQLTNNKYQPNVSFTTFNPTFASSLFFIYLEEKKDSKEAIKNYRNLSTENLASIVTKINTITEQIALCQDLELFKNLITNHENLIASILKTTTVKQDRFHDYTGVVKSLGGWGGDFVLVTGTKNDMSYFSQKGYTTIIPFSEMIL
ncbi:GYDIA family GHMP kinase [Aquimarina agarilytica]|uniref:GYDIA family GHMP kinase n=1 Tax=Aquimarina agarilytica TaxID=1087449 RepID=UPI000288C4EB|nr:GYDIA family GHMP kinase [Aquimarina agarilytica]